MQFSTTARSELQVGVSAHKQGAYENHAFMGAVLQGNRKPAKIAYAKLSGIQENGPASEVLRCRAYDVYARRQRPVISDGTSMPIAVSIVGAMSQRAP